MDLLKLVCKEDTGT